MPQIHHRNGGGNDGSTTDPSLPPISTLSSPPIKVVVKLSRPIKTANHTKTTPNPQQKNNVATAPIQSLLYQLLICDHKIAIL